MKRNYRQPVAEKIEFRYCDQVVATSGEHCDQAWTRQTTHEPFVSCAQCYTDLLWLNRLTL